MQAWNETWKTSKGRADWLEPEPFVCEHLPPPSEAGATRLLDVGCGPGRHAVYAAQRGYRAVGVDSAAAGVRHLHAWSAAERLAIDVAIADMCALPHPNESFECVIAWNVVYHGTRNIVEQAVDEIRRVLIPGGLFILTLISKRNLRYGMGTEIEADTFVNEDDPGETSHPHRFFGWADAESLLGAFDLHEVREAEQKTPKSYHWEMIACRKSSNHE